MCVQDGRDGISRDASQSVPAVVEKARHHRSGPPEQQKPSKRLHFSRWDTQLEPVRLCGMSPLG